ncbi:M23 family metallopeptidase [Candidatus Dojkabacteria bacterium]|nr:M23 family metallopeptidase [Candidatus Dojkabacteria bacterium]
MKKKLILLILGIPVIVIGGFVFKSIVLAKGDDTIIIKENLVADGEFVRGPNVENFGVEKYINKKLKKYSSFQKEIDDQSEMYSINPELLITLIDIQYQNVDLTDMKPEEFNDLIEKLVIDLTDNYYGCIAQAVERADNKLEKEYESPFGYRVKLDDEVNAATNATIFAMIQRMDKQDMKNFARNGDNGDFHKHFSKLFPESDPLDGSNVIDYEIVSGKKKPEKFSLSNSIVQKAQAQSTPFKETLQFPYPIGQSWVFNGVHSTNMSGIDFSPTNPFPSWLQPENDITATDYRVVAAADGIAQKYSNCLVYIDHGGGWKTKYYHLENVQFSQNTSVEANDTIAYLANTYSEAICNTGDATGRHVHFGLMYNGAYTALDGSEFSGWKVNVNTTTPYSIDCTKMYLYRDGVTKCPRSSILNDASTDSCIPSPGLDWVIDGQVCEITSNMVADRNVLVKNNSELRLLANSSLNIDFLNYSIQTEPYGKITIDSTAKLF